MVRYDETTPRQPIAGTAPAADARRAERALAAAAELGPYFAVHGGAPAGSQALGECLAPPRLNRLLDAVANQIGTDERRVAASTLQYAFAARCWSLLLGTWHRTGLLLDTRAIGFVETAPGSIQLTLTHVDAWDVASWPTEQVAAAVADAVIAHPLADVHAAVHRDVRVADGLLWGNAASALASVAAAIAVTRPGARLAAVTAAILSRAPLADRLVATARGGTRRRSCCLWYRTRHRAYCGDCPLTG